MRRTSHQILEIMAKEVKHTRYNDSKELDNKLQSLLDQTKSESEALKKILEALDGRNTENGSDNILKGKKR